MATKYLLTTRLEQVPLDRVADASTPVVEVLSPHEFADAGLGDADTQEALRTLSAAQNSYVDMFPDCMIGSFAIPDKRDVLGEPICFAFYLDKMHLIFVDAGTQCVALLDAIARAGVMKRMTVAHCLFELMKQITKDDLVFLADLEDRMEDVEEAILDRCENAGNRQMLVFRRKLLRLDTYYQQLVDMGSTIAENENKLLTREESRLFALLADQADRLLKRSQTLKEYSLQLRELYQTQIEVQQNDTMKWFTVITTLFAPLTLITSWFGMNFQNMPGLDTRWGYYAIIALSLAIVIGELILFKRKKWL